jgi:hypothetical protein
MSGLRKRSTEECARWKSWVGMATGETVSFDFLPLPRAIFLRKWSARAWKGDERNGVWSRGEWSTVVVNMKERIQDRALSEESEWARFRGAETSLVNFRAAVSL